MSRFWLYRNPGQNTRSTTIRILVVDTFLWLSFVFVFSNLSTTLMPVDSFNLTNSLVICWVAFLPKKAIWIMRLALHVSEGWITGGLTLKFDHSSVPPCSSVKSPLYRSRLWTTNVWPSPVCFCVWLGLERVMIIYTPTCLSVINVIISVYVATALSSRPP